MGKIYEYANEKEACDFVLKLILEIWPLAKLIGLATGSSMERLYQLLVQAWQQGKLPCAGKYFINLDEYVGLLRDHPQSYASYLWRNFYAHVDVDMKNVRCPTCLSDSSDKIAETCIFLEKWIQEHGPVAFWLLGIGENAHFAFFEPGPPEERKMHYHVVELSLSTVKANSRLFGNDIDAVPKKAISAGLRTVLEAERLFQLASGEKKAWAVGASVLGPVTPWVPSSQLQSHPNWTLVTDEEAGMEILKYLAEKKIRPKEDPNGERFYEVVSEAGVTHQVWVSRNLASRHGIPTRTLEETTLDLR